MTAWVDAMNGFTGDDRLYGCLDILLRVAGVVRTLVLGEQVGQHKTGNLLRRDENSPISERSSSATSKWAVACNSSSQPRSVCLETDSDSSSCPSIELLSDTDSVATSICCEQAVSTALTKTSMVRYIIAEEMSIVPTTLTSCQSLSALGIDSFAACRILAAIQEAVGAEISPMLLIDNSTIGEVETAVESQLSILCPSSGSASRRRGAPAIVNGRSESVPVPIKTEDLLPANSILLQGKPAEAAKILFLLPDGSGSSYAYGQIPRIDSSIAVFGLNSPFMRCPEKYVIGLGSVSTLFLKEIRRRQPRGSYCLGGWSAGGIIAYEIALQLMQQGEVVEQLIMIDSPCPMSLQPLPSSLHELLDQIGLLGTAGQGSSPPWLLPHFRMSISALEEYRSVSMKAERSPTVTFIWAKYGVCRDLTVRPTRDQQEPSSMTWLLEDRTDFGDNGWAQLLQGIAMKFETVEGNHFTMMREDNVKQIATILGKCLL